ncbi:MAG TPA: hypothetical protein VHL59_14960 [Thermoanaerobaculia bacterium]|nr:hypothetical protein [Thermoanaerobaculia bacterium]
MNESAGRTPSQRYKLAQYGGGIEELDRFGIRDRIRAGEITAYTELAAAGTEEWRAAAAFPELSRYFEIAALRPRTLAGPMVAPTPPRAVQPMKERIVQGLAYPVAGGEAIMLVGLALLNALPLIRIFATLASTVIMVDIIRTSADGRTKMPLVDTSEAWQLVRTYLRVLFVTLVSLLPVYAFGFYAIAGVFSGTMSIPIALAGLTVLLAVAALYFPACLATVAVWDDILASLNPMYVLRVIRIIGADYFIVVAMWFAATFLTMVFSSPLISPLAAIPFVGAVASGFLSFYVLFYVSHLLGYAVHRHAPELGWE